MVKFIIVFLLFITFQSFAQDVPIQLGASYTEASARIEAFEGVEKKIDRDFLKQYYKDVNKKENLTYIKQDILEIKDTRRLCPFYAKNTLFSYAVIYDNEPKYNFYYNILGKLIKFDIITTQDYPKKVYGYSRYGNLISVSLEVSETEQFVYDENGKLIAHWLNNEMLNKDREIPKFLKLRRGIQN